MSRYVTGPEAQELYERAKYLIGTLGVKPPRMKCRLRYGTKEFSVRLDDDGYIYVSDQVAACMQVDADGGIRSLFGNTAKRVLLDMRKAMLLDDIANV